MEVKHNEMETQQSEESRKRLQKQLLHTRDEVLEKIPPFTAHISNLCLFLFF